MPADPAPPDRLVAAQAAHRAQQVPQALALYQALADDPEAAPATRAAALHGLAVLRAPATAEAAVALLRQALALHPGLAQAGAHLGTLLAALGRPGEAIAAWRAALAAEPAQPLLWRRLATLLRTSPGDGAAEAVAACRHAIAAAGAASPAEQAAIHYEMGLALLADRRPDPAISSLLRARSLDAALPGVAAPLGAALLARGESARAIPVLHAALAEHPADRASRAALARAMLDEGQAEPALALVRRGLALSPGDPALLALSARALLALARPEAALAALRPVLAADTPEFAVLVAAGLVLAALGRPAEALARFNEALTHSPDDVEARHQAGLARLSQGDFAGGWPGFALRGQLARHPPAEARLRQPCWTGEQDPAGRRILLYAERAPEDTLQFIRYLPMLASLGAHLQLRVPPALHALVAAMPALAADPAIVLLAPDAAPAPFELRCALADLPAAFATTLPTVPAVVPYLAPPAQLLADWALALPDGAQHIALGWHEAQSLPLAALADGLAAALPAARLHALGPADATVLPAGVNDLRPHTTGMAALAAALCRMDLVIATDGPSLHLAGALARPCLALLPAVAGWRWLIARHDSPWYPTMRLLRGAGAELVAREAARLLTR